MYSIEELDAETYKQAKELVRNKARLKTVPPSSYLWNWDKVRLEKISEEKAIQIAGHYLMIGSKVKAGHVYKEFLSGPDESYLFIKK